MRVVGLDLGERRIGVSLSDASGTIASPHSVISRSGQVETDHAAVAALVADEGAELVVVGLPIGLSGHTGPAAQRTLDEVEVLRSHLPVPVELVDERFSTVIADRSLRQGKMKGPARRQVVDQVAAAVLLQSWLDRGTPP